MRRKRLSLLRQMTSSRQSPKMSPLSAGVDFVPLLELAPSAVSSRVSPLVPYLSMWLLSSSSRTGSASHQTRKLVEEGLRPAFCPAVLEIVPTAADQASAPGLPAHTSTATPRPLSQLQEGCDQMICPVRASPIQSATSVVVSLGLNTSRPGRLGMKSPTCSASPWWLVAHMGWPLSSMPSEP